MTHDYAPTHNELQALYDKKYYRLGEPGWGPQLRLAKNYFTPDDVYEALLEKTIQPGWDWLDVGCGRDIFPDYPELAVELRERCNSIVGVDPDENVLENEYITQAFHGMIEDFDTEQKFDLVTLRMVAEHIANPSDALETLKDLTKPGGLLIILTPNKWSPMSIGAAITPFALHHPMKKVLWQTEAQDTFPTEYKLNTRKDLLKHTSENDFEEVLYTRLDDCRIFGSYKLLNRMELAICRGFNTLGLNTPENCILGMYRRKSV